MAAIRTYLSPVPLPEEFESIDEHANRIAGGDSPPQKKFRRRRVAALRIYLLVAEKTPNLSCFALQLRRPDPLGGNAGEMHMLGLVQAGDHPAKVAALGLAKLLRQVLAKSLVHLTLKSYVEDEGCLSSEALAGRLWLVSCWGGRSYNLQPSTDR